MIVSSVMTDHPSWSSVGGTTYRVVRSGSATWVLTCTPAETGGNRTAGATVADLTNDYALYPYADLAVRAWADRLSTGRTWPETEPEFACLWARLAGKDLSAWTLLTLTWGVRHANTSGAVAV